MLWCARTLRGQCAVNMLFGARISRASCAMIMLCGARTSRASRVQVTVCQTIFDDLFWWKAPQTRESNQIMTEDAAHQTKGKERHWMENEVMNLKRTGGVKNEMTAQGMCTTFKRTKGGEEDSTRCLRYSTPQEVLVCLFGEIHSFPSNLMCCVCGACTSRASCAVLMLCGACIHRACCVCPNNVCLPPRYPRYSTTGAWKLHLHGHGD